VRWHCLEKVQSLQANLSLVLSLSIYSHIPCNQLLKFLPKLLLNEKFLNFKKSLKNRVNFPLTQLPHPLAKFSNLTCIGKLKLSSMHLSHYLIHHVHTLSLITHQCTLLTHTYSLMCINSYFLHTLSYILDGLHWLLVGFLWQRHILYFSLLSFLSLSFFSLVILSLRKVIIVLVVDSSIMAQPTLLQAYQ
jgi:hypothetical protein